MFFGRMLPHNLLTSIKLICPSQFDIKMNIVLVHVCEGNQEPWSFFSPFLIKELLVKYEGRYKVYMLNELQRSTAHAVSVTWLKLICQQINEERVFQ